jgi:hypothetical protein
MGEPTPMSTTGLNDRNTSQVVETNITGDYITGIRVAFFNGTLAAGTPGEVPATVSRPVFVSIWDGVAWNTAINRTFATGEFSVDAEITLANPIPPGGTWAHWTSTTATNNTFAVPRNLWGDYGDWVLLENSSGGPPLQPTAGVLHASMGVGVTKVGWPPMAIYGRTANQNSLKAVWICGDSVATGNGGGENQAIPKTAWGWPERAIQPYFGLVKCTIPSSTLFAATDPANVAQMASIQNGQCTDALIEMGVNDFGGLRSYGDVYSRVQVLCQNLKSFGIRTHLVTIAPRISTSDSLTSLAGQAPTANCGPTEAMGRWNAKLRQHYFDANPIPNVDHVHDVAARVETSIGSGLWIFDPAIPYRYANPGPAIVVHPTDEGHALLAAGVDISKFNRG